MADKLKEDIEKKLQEIEENLSENLPEELAGYGIWNIVIALGVAVVVVLVTLYIMGRKIKAKVLPSTIGFSPKHRFRKRDKVMFYGRKMLRKVHTFTKKNLQVDPASGRRLKKRQIVFKLAKKLLRFKKEKETRLEVKEPPPSFLEANIVEDPASEHHLPPEVLYMLRSVKVFGHFEKPIFLELCKHMESNFVPASNLLFNVGDADDSIFVVQSGKIQVYITEQDGTRYTVKDVEPGDSIHSLLSVLDVLTGHPAPYKTVSARAVVDSTVLRLPAQAFNMISDRYPESLVRIVQVIMVRLQRVTFMALHNYLGLSHELINPKHHSDMKLSVQSIAALSPRGSPTKMPKQSSSSESADGSGRSPRQRSEERDIDQGSDFNLIYNQARVGSIGSVGSVGSPVGSPLTRQSSDESNPVFSKQRKKDEQVPVMKDINEKYILECASEDLTKLFGFEDEGILEGKLTLRYLKAGTEIIKQWDQDANLLFVVTGTLQVLQQVVGKTKGGKEQTSLFIAHSGELVGALGVLTGEPSFFTIRARTDARVVTISKADFYGIMREHPKIVLNVAHTFVKRMSPFVRQIDFALDWVQIEAGRALFRQDEVSESIYIILNGRLRQVVTQASGKKELVGEYGRGELVGIVEVLTQTERATTSIAVRDTELAKLPADLLNLIKRKYPQIVTRLIHLLGNRILGTIQKREPHHHPALSEHPNVDPRSSVANLNTVAIIPATDQIPLNNFTLELKYACDAIGPTLRLTKDIILNRLGSSALDSMSEYRLSSWLGQQEDIHRIVLYQCDFSVTPWTQRCIRQADCILIVGIAHEEPQVGKIEQHLENLSVRAQKELILLHKEDCGKPRNTAEWLNIRSWCTTTFHLRCPDRVFSKKSKEYMEQKYRKLAETEPDRHSDFSRLGRFLTGTSIGLVLGGGGARGIAQCGMIKAMVEAGIPIDIVGGTSIGSFNGGIWCEERNVPRMIQKAREFSVEMSSIWKKVVDLTYPITSMFTGGGFNRSIHKIFKDRQIEDLWLPYFCITTDITASKMRVHTTGSLWRYVRASMSLSGYLPPLCDPQDGHLLLDGGYVNNLPADVMKSMGAQTIFAIDVGSQDEMDLTDYGDELSGWWLLWKRFNPWAAPVKVPNMNDIQSRLAYVSCVTQLEQVTKTGCCDYLRPPIDKYGTLQFGSFDEIFDAGYNYGKVFFDALSKDGTKMSELFREKTVEDNKPKLHETQVPAACSFTDLAELVSRIEEPRIYEPEIEEESDEDDDDEETTITVTLPRSSPRLSGKPRPFHRSNTAIGLLTSSDSTTRRRKPTSPKLSKLELPAVKDEKHED